MKVSIIPGDEFVYLDGKAYHVPMLKDIAERVHAVQWDGTKGHVEYVQHEDYFTPHADIANLDAFAVYIAEATKLQEQGDPPLPLMPLDVFAYKTRQQIAFSQAKTKDFGVQYSDPVSIGLLTALVSLIDKGAIGPTISYKGPNGFLNLTGPQLTELSFQVAAHVQKAFNAEKSVLEDIEMGTITTHKQIADAFAAAMAA